MSAPLIPGHCPNVTSVAGSTGHTVIQSGTIAQGGSQSLAGASLAQEAGLGHILVPSNTWNPEALAPFRLQANNPGSTDFSKLKSPQKQSTTVCQQRKKTPASQALRHRCCHDGETVQQRDASRRWRQRPLQWHRPRLTQPVQEDRPFASLVGLWKAGLGILLCFGFKGAQGSSPHPTQEPQYPGSRLDAYLMRGLAKRRKGCKC